MKRKIHRVLVGLAICLALVACGPGRITPDTQATKIAVRSRATLRARTLPTSTWTPGPAPASTVAEASEPSGTTPGTQVTSPTLFPPAALSPSAAAPAAPTPAATVSTPAATTALPPGGTAPPAAMPSATQPAPPSSTPTPTATSAASATSTTTPTRTPTPTFTPTPRAPRLAFASDRDGNYEIYTMNDDGSGLTRLTNDPAEDSRPSWSPDGTRVAFDSDRSGNYDIYVMNADGSGLVRLTDDPSHDVFPVWSPDGTRIAFASLRAETDPACDPCNWELYVMQADGSGQTRLTNDPAEDFGPTWSPDGTRLAFDSNRDGSYNIYAMNVDGSGDLTNLTQDPSGSPAWSNVNAAWSPDGTRIAFTTLRDEPDPFNCDPCNWQIYVMGSDGSGPARLTDHTADDDHPAWSPDGGRIAFVSWRDGNAEIYVMNADGSNLVRLTNHPANDWDAVWAPR